MPNRTELMRRGSSAAAKTAELRTQLTRARAEHESRLRTYESELRDARDELGKAAEELRASRTRYTELYDLAPVAYATLTRQGIIAEVNLPGAALLAQERLKLIGRPLIADIADSDKRRFLEHMRRCRSEPGPIITELNLHVGEAEAVPVELTSRGSPHPGPGADLFHTVIVNLTERQRNEEALRRSERLAGLGTLTAGLAHELKNPLHAILMTAQVTLRRMGNRLSKDERRALDDIAEEVRRCDRIIKNMLLSAREQPTEKWPADLNAIVRRCIGVARASGMACRFELEAQRRPALIRANPTELEQVLLNLFRNAIEARNGECQVRVQTQIVAPHNGASGHVCLTVADNGAGIPREALPHVFDPFFTTRRARGGTGLGLSVVHAIIADHAGTIRAESEPGQGARFVIEFPLAVDPPPPGEGFWDERLRTIRHPPPRRGEFGEG